MNYSPKFTNIYKKGQILCRIFNQTFIIVIQPNNSHKIKQWPKSCTKYDSFNQTLISTKYASIIYDYRKLLNVIENIQLHVEEFEPSQ